VSGGEYPAVIDQRRATVEAPVTQRNSVEQHATGNLALKRHQPRPFALSEPFAANQPLHDAMTLHAVTCNCN